MQKKEQEERERKERDEADKREKVAFYQYPLNIRLLTSLHCFYRHDWKLN